jgi:hypothetical protein
MEKQFKEPKNVSLKHLYPNQSEDWLKAAEENLRRYVEVALAVYEELRADPDRYENFQKLLTRIENDRKVKPKGRNKLTDTK